MKRSYKVMAILAVIGCLISILMPLHLSVSAEKIGPYTYQVQYGEVVITGCDKSVSGSIEIPSTLGGYR